MKPLLRRTPPLEDELLSSYLWRLSQLNRYATPQWLWQLCKQPRVLHSGANRRELLWSLSTLTGQSVPALFDLTLHALAEHLTSPHTVLERAELEPGVTRFYADAYTLSHTLRSEGAVWWCPHCLLESHYFRKRWLAPLVAGCPEHGTLLAQGCPQCHRGVGVLEVLEGICRGCKASLTYPLLSQMKLTALERQSQRWIHAWLRGQVLERPSSWPEAESRALYPFIWGLTIHRPEWPGLASGKKRKRLPLLKRTTLETLGDVNHALWVLKDWPLRLESWLESCCPPSFSLAPHPTLSIKWDRAWRRALPLWTEWMEGRWKGETFEWLQDALDRFLARHYNHLPLTTSPRAQQRPALILHLEHLRKEDLAFILDETQEMLEWLHRADCMGDHWTREAAKKTYPEVLKLKTRLKRPLCLREVAQLLRLPLFTVVRLIEEQHLPFDFVSILDKEARACWSEVKQVIIPLFERIEYGHNGVTLEQAGRMMGVFDLDERPLLEAVLEGRINLQYLYQSEFPQERVKGWAFSRETLEAFSRPWRRERGWLSLKETSLVFGVHPGVVRDWVRDRLLPSVEGTFELWPHFEEEGVHDFARRFVSPSEVGRRLGVRAKQLKRWGEAGVLGSAYRPLKPHARWAWPLLEWEGLLEWWESGPPERLACEAQRGSQARASAKR